MGAIRKILVWTVLLVASLPVVGLATLCIYFDRGLPSVGAASSIPLKACSHTTQLARPVTIQQLTPLAKQGFLALGRRKLGPSWTSNSADQLARWQIAQLPQEPTRSLGSQMRLLIQSVKVELAFSDNELLSGYLNRGYFGNDESGLSCASRFYFKKEPEQLTLADATLLQSLLHSPISFNPIKYPEKAKERRDQLLDQLANDGMISADAASAAKAQALLP